MASQHEQLPPSIPTSNEELTAMLFQLSAEVKKRRAQCQHFPLYPFAQAEPPLQKFVFDPIRELSQNPYQSYSAPSTFEKFPPESREKKVDTALASIQTHLSHLTRPIDQLAFETMENYTDWSYRDENGNINEGLQGYESIEDLATHFDEIHGEQTMSILRRLNEYRSYLSDLSHRLTDARLNLALTAL
ncbi:hypothetical protein BGX33_002959, partial [Mortierella sp. NVP41]